VNDPVRPDGWIKQLLEELRLQLTAVGIFARFIAILLCMGLTAMWLIKPDGAAIAITALVLGAMCLGLVARITKID